MVYNKKIFIAIGKNRLEKNWKNIETTWLDFISILKKPKITYETKKQYENMDKITKANIKDVGGFIGGRLKNGRRGNGNVLYRSLITLDVDTPQKNFIEKVKKTNCAYFLYTTHSHTKENPRYRLILPLKDAVTEEEYEMISKIIANQYGIKNFDKTTFQADRLMYWPSRSKDDNDFYTFYNDGSFLDGKRWLKQKKEKTALREAQKHGKDPRKKQNIVGLFCRKYSITKAIDTFLSNIYEKTDDDRYTYIQGTSSKGLVIFDDLFAYSHHSTDPIYGKAVNSFDLVRIHLFREKDLGIDEDIPIIHYPSYKEMERMLLQDKEIQEDCKEINVKTNNFDDEFLKENKAWLKELKYGNNKKLLPTINNFETIFRKDKYLKNNIYLDKFDLKIKIKSNLPWRKIIPNEQWKDSDFSALYSYIEKNYNIWNEQMIKHAFINICEENSFNTLKSYLEELKWDGNKRVENLFIDYLGAVDNIYTRAVARVMLVGAVARVMQPGYKFDYVLITVGKQGIGKSTLPEKLAKKGFRPGLSKIDTKDAKVDLQGAWIIELSEMDATSKASIESIKSFISVREDIFRMPYQRTATAHKRQCIFWGTSNIRGLLRDKTGNRRFLPVDVGMKKSKYNPFYLEESTVDQIWAEAFQMYQNNTLTYLDEKEEEIAEIVRTQHSDGDDMEGRILEYLEIPITKDWYRKTIFERRMYIENFNEKDLPEETVKRDKICVAEIWQELLGDKKIMQSREKSKIKNILDNLDDWNKYIVGRGKLRFGLGYGIQPAYIRKNNENREK